MAALLEIENLVVEATGGAGPRAPVIRGASLRLEAGEVLALIGESGSGKTTLALSALGYARPGLEFRAGEVRLGGDDLLAMAPDEKRRLRGQRVAYLAQSAAAAFNPALRIGAQVTEASVLHGQLSQAEADRRAAGLFRALGLPDPDRLGRCYPHQVSGGQLQRLMAAMALCARPDLLILDEPTTALDVTTQIEVLKAFKDVIRREGAAALYVSHDLAVVAQVADRIAVLHAGEIKEYGSVDEILHRPQHRYTRQLIDAVRPPPDTAPEPPVAKDVEQDVPALEVTHLSAGYGRKQAGGQALKVLRDVHIRVERGHTLGVIGESGCGKSTLARVISGLLPAMQGEVRLKGQPLKPGFRQRERRQLQKIQFVFQMADNALNPHQRVEHLLGRPLEFYFGLTGDAKRRRIAELLHLVELPPEFSRRYPEELSGGQKQRINLARALAASPEILLCDEVISALDTLIGASILRLLKHLRQQTGASFVFISHDLSAVASFADDIAVLYAGQVAEQGPARRVLAPPYHPYTRLLVASVPKLDTGWLERTLKLRETRASIDQGVEITDRGCPFYRRCPLAIAGTCDRETPPLHTLDQGHTIACHRSEAELRSASFT